MKRKDEHAITLIALIITIIIMLILAGVVISLTIGENGLFKTAKYAVAKNSETEAREKLELLLLDLQADKIADINYNENEYINTRIQQNEMKVNGNIVDVNGWKFTIDRSVPRILEKNEKIIFDLETASKDLTITNVDIDENGIADFSKDNSWIKINQSFNPGNQKWEMATKVSFTQFTSNYLAIFGKTGAYNPPSLCITSNKKLLLYVSSNDTSWNIASNEGTTTLELNKWYWIKVSYDMQKYQVFISMDGENYTQDISVINPNVAAQGDAIAFGRNAWSGATVKQQLYGKIDLTQTYIKYETEYLFKGNRYLKTVVKE